MKRSHGVIAVLAAATVGAGAYSMTPSERCVRSDGGAALDPSARGCRDSGSGGHGSGARYGAYGGSGGSSSVSPSASRAGITRGGFGGFFSSLGAHLGG